MPEVKSIIREVLPKQGLDLRCVEHGLGRVCISLCCVHAVKGQLSMEDVPTMVLCKPKLLPLKSVTLEKLEKMQMEAQEAVRQQELAGREQCQ